MILEAISGILISVSLLLNFIPERTTAFSRAPVTESIVASLEQKQKRPGLPARLEIPSIGVDTVIEYVGLMPDGTMGTPEGPNSVAWLELGPRPGEVGSSVIAGHYGWKDDMPAAFDDLDKLDEGDQIFIEDENGAIITFVVREKIIYGKDELVPEVFGSSDGKAHLNLITCTGNWSEEERSSSHRLVVFTDLA